MIAFSNFSTFFYDLLHGIADFLWMDSIKWIVGCVVFLFVCEFIKRLINI